MWLKPISYPNPSIVATPRLHLLSFFLKTFFQSSWNIFLNSLCPLEQHVFSSILRVLKILTFALFVGIGRALARWNADDVAGVLAAFIGYVATRKMALLWAEDTGLRALEAPRQFQNVWKQRSKNGLTGPKQKRFHTVSSTVQWERTDCTNVVKSSVSVIRSLCEEREWEHWWLRQVKIFCQFCSMRARERKLFVGSWRSRG